MITLGLIPRPSQEDKTALHYAAENGLVAMMETLAAMGADLNAATKVHAPLGALWLGGKERGRKGAALHEGLS